MDYLMLVNKQNIIKEEVIDLKKCYKIKDFETNKDVYVEKKTYRHFLRLRKCLLKHKIDIAISSSYRSFKAQQDIIDRYTIKYGKDYVKQYVANVGASEHHTGLCMDIALKDGNKYIYENEDLEKRKKEFYMIHSLLYKYGFILRYPKDKENITGYNYEPWHIRYVGKRAAKYIYKNNITLEEYLLL